MNYAVKWTNGDSATDPRALFSLETEALHYARENARGRSWSVWLGGRLVVSYDALQGMRRGR